MSGGHRTSKRKELITMTAKNFFRYYNRLNGADRYFLIFHYAKYVWIVDVLHIALSWCVESRESSKRGNIQKWKIRAASLPKEKLVKKAVRMMTIREFNQLTKGKNKGDFCEAWLCENFGCVPSTSNKSARFDKCGDVVRDGIQYQVKYQNASLTNVKSLHNAQADARAKRKAERAQALLA